MFRPLHSTLSGITRLKKQDSKIKEHRNPIGTNKKQIQMNTNKTNNKTPIHITPPDPNPRTRKSQVFRTG